MTRQQIGLINNTIQLGLLIVGLITFYFMLKRDKRKALRWKGFRVKLSDDYKTFRKLFLSSIDYTKINP